MPRSERTLPPYRRSLAGSLLAAREAVMSPIRPMLREVGVTEQQWRVLRVLRDAGPMDPTNLARSALLFAPSLTRILKELLDRGLVARETDPADRRSSIITLSPSGGTLIRETSRRTVRHLDRCKSRFGEARLERLIAELHALIDAVGDEDEAPSNKPRDVQRDPSNAARAVPKQIGRPRRIGRA